ncbi:zinc ribbon domain-containing protein [Streptomyces sp. NPDC001177]
MFLTILHAKAESAGREVIAVDPHNTSRTCPECGHTAKENRPTLSLPVSLGVAELVFP